MATLATPTGAPRNNSNQRLTWQEKLQAHSRLKRRQTDRSVIGKESRKDTSNLHILQVNQGQFTDISSVLSASGGRTAWSSTVTIQGRNFSARYFYDGQNTNNAKEDAAEVALTALRSQGSPAATSLPGQLYAQNQAQGGNAYPRWN
ncbi:hypothetical protein AJ79_03555 [Helicocarpus griseus UAMH5409]|uniref:DRBM domain-containing protein n=1 Tax=Helicocarpus griseus UAMH5409 TaxID=1447875 RepID=A0A2B7XY62_9EURO|nr:hypothetical protein AJ79_03555 [Helicocarpus griseus UAMH5409]